MEQGWEKIVSIGGWDAAGTSYTDFVIIMEFSIAAFKKNLIPQC
jgi:hypothetical protein